ncbi:MAG: hypothetical protein HY698_20580 [Deltaproteobacteria bacterium]|nr:hypothetical protein [Deltaproteobacteria bacterium]
MNSLVALPEGQGADMNGDGKIDNSFGPLADLLNPTLNGAVKDGGNILLFDMFLGEKPSVAFFRAIDANAKLDDNLTGDGEFLVPSEQFDVSCKPTSMFENARWENGRLVAKSEQWAFVIPHLGSIEFTRAGLDLEVAQDRSGYMGLFTGTWTTCGLTNIGFGSGTSFLDVLVNNFELAPDIDMDGDGLERVVGDGTRVIECVDAQNNVIAKGSDCGCHPEMADGYSVAFDGTGVPATIVGTY